LIISGGYNIYPKEIEAIVDDLPEVLESAVIGLPDADFGEAVTLIIVLKPGASLQAGQVITYLKHGIANFKVTEKIFLLANYPAIRWERYKRISFVLSFRKS